MRRSRAIALTSLLAGSLGCVGTSPTPPTFRYFAPLAEAPLVANHTETESVAEVFDPRTGLPEAGYSRSRLVSTVAGFSDPSQPQTGLTEASYSTAAEPVDDVANAELVVSLDAVFRLAEVNNPRLAAGRERLGAACLGEDIAAKGWLPEVTAGISYFRHEGGIQLQEGPLIHSSTGSLFAGAGLDARFAPAEKIFRELAASRERLQTQAELRQLTSETLADAASTYIDLLAVLTIRTINANLSATTAEQLEAMQKLAEVQPAAESAVVTLEGTLTRQQQEARQNAQQAAAASAKLAYLLGYPPEVAATLRFLPADTHLVPLNLIDPTIPTEVVVAQALAVAPGLQEAEAILAQTQEGQARAAEVGLWPVLRLWMLEGGLGAGANSSLDWDNRWDLGVAAEWNLTAIAQAGDQRRVLQARQREAQLTYDDQRNRLVLTVRGVMDIIRSAAEQLPLAEEQLTQARRLREISEERLQVLAPGATPTDVAQAAQAEASALLNYLAIVREFNQAQLRLMVLIGPSPSQTPTPDPSTTNAPR